jgi:hypothetical protein
MWTEFAGSVFRTSSASRAKGERVGTLPFGARLAADGVRLVADEAEQGLFGRHKSAAATVRVE